MDLAQIFQKCQKLSLSKRQDYTSKPETDSHENFKRSSTIASWFTEDTDKSYVVLIGTKLARLASLLGKSEAPKHESIEDSFIDLINYCALWAERRLDYENQETHELIARQLTKFEDDHMGGDNEETPYLDTLEKQAAFYGLTVKQLIEINRRTDLSKIMHDLNEEELSDLLSRARIYMMRKKTNA